MKRLIDVILRRKAPAPAWVKKVCQVQGEINPGFLKVDVATYDESGNLVPNEIVTLDLKITPRLRPSFNRIIQDVETEEDMDILNSLVVRSL